MFILVAILYFVSVCLNELNDDDDDVNISECFYKHILSRLQRLRDLFLLLGADCKIFLFTYLFIHERKTHKENFMTSAETAVSLGR